MSLARASIVQRWAETKGTDPIFAMIDGANCPQLPAAADKHAVFTQQRIAAPQHRQRVVSTQQLALGDELLAAR